MQILKEYPPNYELIRRTFDLSGHKPIFAWGDKIYNPHNADITEDLVVHESTHSKQQQILGVEMWWHLYLTDATFRLKQEVEAYQAQYQFISKYLERKYRRKFLHNFAKALSSKLYGNLLTMEQAEEIIKC